MLFLDLDNFKRINDSLGHDAGDRLLIAATERLRGCLQSEDTLARLGGDEFTVLMEEVSSPRAPLLVAEHIVEALRAPCDLDGQQVFTATSIGIAISSPEADQASDLLRDADLAMYQAKAAGKGRHEMFDPSMRAQLSQWLMMEAELRQAIERGEMRVHTSRSSCLNPKRSARLRRWFAGSTPSVTLSRRPSSSHWPSRPA